MGSAYLGEADVSGPVLVLIRCKDKCHAMKILRLGETYKEVHQEIYGIKVEGCNPYEQVNFLKAAENVRVQSPLTNAISKNIIDVKWLGSGSAITYAIRIQRYSLSDPHRLRGNMTKVFREKIAP
jgi:hypothetical protein